MNWESFSQFAAMGGYATYVWGSFGAVAAALALESVLVRRRCELARRNLQGRPDLSEDLQPVGEAA